MCMLMKEICIFFELKFQECLEGSYQTIHIVQRGIHTENLQWHGERASEDHFWNFLPLFLPPLLLCAKTQIFCPGLMVLPSVQPETGIKYSTSFRDTIIIIPDSYNFLIDNIILQKNLPVYLASR